MTTHEWLEQARRDSVVIRSLIEDFHPSMTSYFAKSIYITAPNAEVACQNVRTKIKQEQRENPIERFDKALIDGNVSELMSVMNGAWFGVPESTSCWQVDGFREAVALLEDPPEDEV